MPSTKGPLASPGEPLVLELVASNRHANRHALDLAREDCQVPITDRRIGLVWAARALGCSVNLLKSEHNRSALDLTVTTLGTTVSYDRLLQYGSAHGVQVEARLAKLRRRNIKPRGQRMTLLEAQRIVGSEHGDRFGLREAIAQASFVEYRGRKPVRMLAHQTFERLIKQSSIGDPQTLSGLADLLELKDRDTAWCHVKSGRIETEPRNVKKVRLNIESVLFFVARFHPDKLQLVYSAAKTHRAFAQEPGLREEWAQRVSIVRAILRGYYCCTEAQVKERLKKTDLEVLPTSTRNRLGAIPFGDTWIYTKLNITREVLRLRAIREHSPLVARGAQIFFAWSNASVQHHIAKGHLKLVLYPSGESRLDPRKLRDFAADYLAEKPDRDQRLAKLEWLIERNLSPAQRIDAVLQQVSALPPHEKLTRKQIDTLGAEIAVTPCTTQEIQMFLAAAERMVQATVHRRFGGPNDTADSRSLDAIINQIAAKKRQVLASALRQKRQSELDLSFLTESDRRKQAARESSRCEASSRPLPGVNGNGADPAPKPLRTDLPDRGHAAYLSARRAAILAQISAEGEAAIVMRDVGILERVGERYVTPVIRQIADATAQSSFREIARRLVQKKLLDHVLPDTFDKSADAALFYFDPYVVGKQQAKANLKTLVSRYRSLDQVVEDRVLGTVLGADRSATGISQAVVRRRLLSWKLPEGHSILQGRGKECRYLNSVVMGSNERVVANAHDYIRRNFISVEDFNAVTRTAEIMALGKALGVGNSPKRLACYAVQHALVTPYLQAGQEISLHARYSYTVDADVVGLRVQSANLHTWFKTQLSKGRRFPFPMHTNSPWHELFGIAGLRKADAIKALERRGFYD